MHAFFISGIPKQQEKTPFRAALSAPAACEGTTKVIENSNIKGRPIDFEAPTFMKNESRITITEMTQNGQNRSED